jgi:hypothetical protein
MGLGKVSKKKIEQLKSGESVVLEVKSFRKTLAINACGDAPYFYYYNDSKKALRERVADDWIDVLVVGDVTISLISDENQHYICVEEFDFMLDGRMSESKIKKYNYTAKWIKTLSGDFDINDFFTHDDVYDLFEYEFGEISDQIPINKKLQQKIDEKEKATQAKLDDLNRKEKEKENYIQCNVDKDLARKTFDAFYRRLIYVAITEDAEKEASARDKRLINIFFDASEKKKKVEAILSEDAFRKFNSFLNKIKSQ